MTTIAARNYRPTPYTGLGANTYNNGWSDGEEFGFSDFTPAQSGGFSAMTTVLPEAPAQPLNWPQQNPNGGGWSGLPNYGQQAYSMYAGMNQGLAGLESGIGNFLQQQNSRVRAEDAYAAANAANLQRYNQVLGNPQSYATSTTSGGRAPGWYQDAGGWVYDANGTPGTTTQIKLTPEQQRANELIKNSNGGLRERYVRAMQGYDDLQGDFDQGANDLRSLLATGGGAIQNKFGQGARDLTNQFRTESGQVADRFNQGAGDVMSRFDAGAADLQALLGGSDQTQGYWDRYQRGLDNLEGAGKVQEKKIRDEAKKSNSIRQMNLAARGLGNTTIADSVDRSTAIDTQNSLNDLEESLRQQRLTTDATLSGDALDYAGKFGQQRVGLGRDLLGAGTSLGQGLLGQQTNLYSNFLNQGTNLGQNLLSQGVGIDQDLLGQGMNLNQNLLGQDIRLGQDALRTDQNLSADILNFIAGRNDMLPDLNSYYNIQRGYGRYA